MTLKVTFCIGGPGEPPDPKTLKSDKQGIYGYNCWIHGYILPYLYPMYSPTRGLQSLPPGIEKKEFGTTGQRYNIVIVPSF